jgi:hypothetical protein
LRPVWFEVLTAVVMKSTVIGNLHHMTVDLGSPRSHAGPCTLPLWRHSPSLSLHPGVLASLRYLCSFILHRIPMTHSLDFSPPLVGPLPTTPIHFSPVFPTPATAPFQGHTKLWFLFPIGSLMRAIGHWRFILSYGWANRNWVPLFHFLPVSYIIWSSD